MINVLHPRGKGENVRKAHAAIRALNVELVQVRDKVSNEDMGRARMTWYKAGLESISSHTPHPRAPVMDAIAETCPQLSARLLSLVDARAADLGYPNVPTTNSLLRIASGTHGLLAELHSLILDDSVDTAPARDAGTAAGLVVLLRGAPAHAAARLSYVPRELLGKHGLIESDLLNGGPVSAPVYKEIADAARNLVEKTRQSATNIPAVVKPALWGVRIADIYLSRLAKVEHDPFNPRLRASMAATYPIRLQIALLSARITGRV